MQAFIKAVLALLFYTITIALTPITGQAAERDIILLHTNDIHCAVNDGLGLARVGWLKQELKKENPNVILIDAGDAIQGAPVGRLSKGNSMITIMNAVGYDFCIPGNHEFDYGMDRFLELSKKLDAGYYCANMRKLYDQESILPTYKIFTFEETKVALIGVTTPETLTSSTPIFFQDEYGQYIYSFCEDNKGTALYSSVQECINEVRKAGAEYVFLVAHLGKNGGNKKWTSVALARNTYGVNGIVDGHSHEQYNQLVVNKLGDDVLLMQTGNRLAAIGQINITPKGKIKSKLIREIAGEADIVKKVISQEIFKYEPLLEQPVGEALVKLHSFDPQTGDRLVRRSESNMGDFVADSFRAVLNCDAAIANGGGIRKEIAPGIITYKNLIEAFPFGNMCSVIEVTGQQLLDALEVGVRKNPEESGGFLQVAGLSYSIDSTIPSSVIMDTHGDFVKVDGQYRVHNVMIGDEPLDLNKNYTLGGIDYILRHGGNGMTMFKGARVIKDAVIQDYDAILEYLQNHLNGCIDEKYANPYGEGRISVISDN